jgi:hypothetical protein
MQVWKKSQTSKEDIRAQSTSKDGFFGDVLAWKLRMWKEFSSYERGKDTVFRSRRRQQKRKCRTYRKEILVEMMDVLLSVSKVPSALHTDRREDLVKGLDLLFTSSSFDFYCSRLLFQKHRRQVKETHFSLRCSESSLTSGVLS